MTTRTDEKGVENGWLDDEDGWGEGMRKNLDILSAMGAEAFAWDRASSSGLSFAYRGATLRSPTTGAFFDVDPGDVLLTNNATNYVESDTSGNTSANTTGFTVGRLPIAKVVALSGAIETVYDRRAFMGGAGSAGAVRTTVSFTTAPGLEDAVMTGTVALGASSFPVKITADHRCWIRLYATSADRTSDATRTIDEDPTTPILLDVILDSALSAQLNPNWPMVNRDSPAANDIYYAVTMLDGIVGSFAQVAADSPAADANLSAHAPTAPGSSGWTAWEYTGSATVWVAKSYGAILAIGNPACVARSNVDFAHTAELRMQGIVSRLSVDVPSSTSQYAMFVPSTVIGSYNNFDYLAGGITRNSSADVNAQIVYVHSDGTPEVLDTALGITWAINASKLMWFEREVDIAGGVNDVVLYLSDSDFAHRTEICRAALPSHFASITTRRIGLIGLGNAGSGGLATSLVVSVAPFDATAVAIDFVRVKVEEVF